MPYKFIKQGQNKSPKAGEGIQNGDFFNQQ